MTETKEIRIQVGNAPAAQAEEEQNRISRIGSVLLAAKSESVKKGPASHGGKALSEKSKEGTIEIIKADIKVT